jgi:hypothetical protein
VIVATSFLSCLRSAAVSSSAGGGFAISWGGEGCVSRAECRRVGGDGWEVLIN